jgi:hypothetical protein
MNEKKRKEKKTILILYQVWSLWNFWIGEMNFEAYY